MNLPTVMECKQSSYHVNKSRDNPFNFCVHVTSLPALNPYPIYSYVLAYALCMYVFTVCAKNENSHRPLHMKGKGWKTGREGCRKLRLPESMSRPKKAIRFVSPTHSPPLTPRKHTWCTFCKIVSRTQDHSAVGGITSIKIPVEPSGI